MSPHQVGHWGSTQWRGFWGILCTFIFLVLPGGHTDYLSIHSWVTAVKVFFLGNWFPGTLGQCNVRQYMLHDWRMLKKRARGAWSKEPWVCKWATDIESKGNMGEGAGHCCDQFPSHQKFTLTISLSRCQTIRIPFKYSKTNLSKKVSGASHSPLLFQSIPRTFMCCGLSTLDSPPAFWYFC